MSVTGTSGIGLFEWYYIVIVKIFGRKFTGIEGNVTGKTQVQFQADNTE